MDACANITEDTWCVYVHTNLINGKKYIGITSKPPNRRWRNGKGYEPGQYFYNAIQKYGLDSFSHDVLLTNLSQSEAQRMERELIAKYNTTCELYGYNLTAGGEGSLGRVTSDSTKKKIGDANRGRTLSEEARAKISASLINNKHMEGHKHTEETKKKISESLIGNDRAKGYKHTDDTRMKMSKSHIGIKFSDEHRRNISKANKGKTLSDETRAKISKSKTGKPHIGCVMSEETKKKMSDSKKELFAKEPWRSEYISNVNKIMVDMFSKDGEFIKTYNSAKDASDELGIDNSSICKVCKNKAKSAGGYIWRYHPME